VKYILLFFSLTTCLCAQTLERSAISAAGGYGGNAVVTVDWTLGETLVERTPITGQHLTQGFHQPFRIIPAAASPQHSLSNIRIYPNPFQLSLNLEGDDLKKANLVELFDASGKSIYSQDIPPQTDALELFPPSLPAGTYLLKITGHNQMQSVFSLIKN
jgi:hypothetical protein